MRIDRFIYGILSSCFIISVLLIFITCADEYYLGKSKEELHREMFEVDSLIKTIQMQLDSTSIDFKKFYIDAQRINNGHE
jgi:hypothetical protein|tara:strand:- start:563 stop:802 length:240 start_codon:yes stop_codon:yes gene_type:complete